MSDIIETLLLLALPASGKSEVRRYLRRLPPEARRKDFHIGPTVQLDDFPYVHAMRRIDDELARAGLERIFFVSGDRPFRNARDWGTLIGLVNEDYADLTAKRAAEPASAAGLLLDRLEAAAETAGIGPRLGKLDAAVRGSLEKSLEREAAELLRDKQRACPDTLDGKTLVIEFARGGPAGAAMPLTAPLGYGYSIGRLSPEILEKAAILYVWVTPEESRRKNLARTDPNDPGSILHHGVPLEVMMNDYGCDDMDWLESCSDRKGTVRIEAGKETFRLPVARFDNRVDKTSFLREDPKLWRAEAVRAVHEGLKSAFDRLASSPSA